jgi:uncharacterized membrane protein (DUF2068 family)
MSTSQSGDRWIVLIAVFKLVKGVLLISAAIGALRLLHKDVAEVVERWIDALRVDPDNRYVQALLLKVLTVNDRTLKEISAGTFCYAAVFLTEGTGLFLRKRWAEYFTIIVTASFLPLEIYELAKHASAAKVLVILLNVAIVAYLVVHVRRRKSPSSPDQFP